MDIREPEITRDQILVLRTKTSPSACMIVTGPEPDRPGDRHRGCRGTTS